MESFSDLILVASALLDSGLELLDFLDGKNRHLAMMAAFLGLSQYYTVSISTIIALHAVGVTAGQGVLMAARTQLAREAETFHVPKAPSCLTLHSLNPRDRSSRKNI